MITINKYLDDILFDFKEYVTSGVRLCDLRKFTSMQETFPIIQTSMFSSCIC